MSPGDAGCLRAGTYEEDDQQIEIKKGGTSPSQRVTIMSAPGERAEIKGRLWVAQEASYVTIRDLDLDGSNTLEPDPEQEGLPSPTVNGSDAQFINDDVTNNDAEQVCFLLGNEGYGQPSRTLIQDSRIHNCGKGNDHQHGIYVGHAYDTQIIGNYIYDNAGLGVQLYPNAQNTLVKNNVIDGNGENVNIGGDGTYAPSNNAITNNMIANATVGWNVGYYWPDPNTIGQGNRVQYNCLGRAAANTKPPNGGITQPQTGFSTQGNRLVGNPPYVDKAAKDFRLRTYSSCSGVYPG